MHIAFDLHDFFQEDPLREISMKWKQDGQLFYLYIDYHGDFESLQIAWQRLQQEYRRIGEIDLRIRQIPPPNGNYESEAASLYYEEIGIMKNVLYDVRAFIGIARTIMDKLAKLIEKLLGLSQGRGTSVSFSKHKKYLPERYPNIHPIYLDFLENKTHWYNQELLLLRDKTFEHGNTLLPYVRFSKDDGMTIFKKFEFSLMKESDKKDLLEIIPRYEAIFPNLKVIDDDFGMLYDFLHQTRRLDIKLDKKDVGKIRDIVYSFGIKIDKEFLESIAHHLEDFIKQVAIIFKDSI